MKGQMQNMGCRYRTWGSEVEFGMQRWDIGQVVRDMEYKTQMEDVQGVGCRRGIWDAEVGYRTQEMGCECRTWNAGVGCRVLQDMGCSSTRAQPQLCTGIVQHPWRWGVRATSREMQTSKEKIIAFQAHTDILQLVPHLGGRSQPFGHICLPDVPERGTEPLWMGKLPTPLCAGQVGNAAPHLLWRKAWMGPGSSGKEGVDGSDPASQTVSIAVKLLFCGWGRWQ